MLGESIMKINRLNQIETYLQEAKSVTLDKLCELYNVSKNTIRRDVAELEKRGSIKKVYGGIMLNKQEATEPFESREIKNKAAKKAVAKAASKLVADGDVIYIDSGTTTMHMIPYLAKRENLTIITSNLHAITSAIPYATLNVIATGGVLYRPTIALAGSSVIEFLDKYNISLAFLASTGVSLTKGVTNTSPLEYEIKKYLIEKSEKTALLVDDSKLDVISLMTYCALADLDYFVTNKQPPQAYLDYFAAHQVTVLTP